jgi:hypothetical protein
MPLHLTPKREGQACLAHGQQHHSFPSFLVSSPTFLLGGSTSHYHLSFQSLSNQNLTVLYLFHALYRHPPLYSHIHVFGCKYYPNLSATSAQILAPRSVLCVFLGYSSNQKGYQCLDLSTNYILISHHVTFDKSVEN